MNTTNFSGISNDAGYTKRCWIYKLLNRRDTKITILALSLWRARRCSICDQSQEPRSFAMIDVNDPSISTPMGQNCPATFKIVVPTVDEGLALRIEEALSVLVFSLVEKAHDVQSQFKVIAELHKLARLKQQRHRRAMDIARLRLSERRMAALEN